MKLLLATHHLGLGGSESYLFTVAEQLERLGHEVALYAAESGPGADVVRDRGLTLIGEEDLAGDHDAALVQDSAVSLQIADRCRGLPQLFVAHSGIFDLQAPPQLDGVVGAIVALNDLIATRMRRYAVKVEVVRLRQPIDTERFFPRGPLPEAPRKALFLSNTPHADRLSMIESAFADAGIELARVGGPAGQTADPRAALAEADIVIGYGRSILEGMACGCAAYVYDYNGGDGWVTRESYPAIEAAGFTGCSGRLVVDPARIGADLGAYAASMGPVNHDLVAANHSPNPHAHELLELLERLADPPARPRAPLQEMARLVRLEWRARGDVQALVRENIHMHELLTRAEQSAREAWEAVDAERQRAHEVATAYESTMSWRLTRPLRALGGMLRQLARRRSQ